MALLDVSEVLDDPDFFTLVTVHRRVETLVGGVAQIASTPYPNVQAVVYPAGDNAVVRDTDMQYMGNGIAVVTRFALRGPAVGFQPDVVEHKGARYVVTNVESYENFGAGFVMASCQSHDALDPPPETTDG